MGKDLDIGLDGYVFEKVELVGFVNSILKDEEESAKEQVPTSLYS